MTNWMSNNHGVFITSLKINGWNLKITQLKRNSFEPNLHDCVPTLFFRRVQYIIKFPWVIMVNVGKYSSPIVFHVIFPSDLLIPPNGGHLTPEKVT